MTYQPASKLLANALAESCPVPGTPEKERLKDGKMDSFDHSLGIRVRAPGPGYTVCSADTRQTSSKLPATSRDEEE